LWQIIFLKGNQKKYSVKHGYNNHPWGPQKVFFVQKVVVVSKVAVVQRLLQNFVIILVSWGIQAVVVQRWVNTGVAVPGLWLY
jgi:hypothetical protein